MFTKAKFGVFATLLALLAGFVASALPASAHSGGKAIVRVASLTLEPASTGWQASVRITDTDSGDPIRGSKVTLAMASAPAKEATLAEASTPGAYQGALASSTLGQAEVVLKVRAAPGADPVAPFNGTFPVTLVSGETAVVVAGGEGGGSNLPLIMGVAAAVLAVALLYGLYSVRRRTAAPVVRK
ncbi:MAG: hypothetical protein ACT4QF_13325 [Sporichthyaceae bacterium]